MQKSEQHIKWPRIVVLIRHAQSEDALLRKKKAEDPGYQEFSKRYEKELKEREGNSPRTRFSKELKKIAEVMAKRFSPRTRDKNTPLTSDGVAQARMLGFHYHSIHPHVVVCSPYLCTRQTLRHMSEFMPKFSVGGKNVLYDARLSQQENGFMAQYNDSRICSVLHPDEFILQEQYGEYYAKWTEGESVDDVVERAKSFINTLVQEYQEKDIFVITHDTNILAIRAVLEQWSPAMVIKQRRALRPKNCAVTVYDSTVSELSFAAIRNGSARPFTKIALVFSNSVLGTAPFHIGNRVAHSRGLWA